MRLIGRITDRTIGPRCKGCRKRKPLSEFRGCSRCGDSYCKDCTAGDTESRICPPCREEIGDD